MTNRNQRHRGQPGGTLRNPSEPAQDEIAHLVSLFNQRRYAEAEVFAQKLTERFPRSGFGWKVLGAVLKTAGRIADSVAPMQKAAELLRNDPQAQTNLGVTLKELGRLKEAELCYLRAIRIKPDYAEAHNTLGNIYKELGRFTEAEASYRQALKIIPGYADACSNLGSLLHDRGRFTEAESCYLRALDISPDFPNAHYNLGNTYKDMERLQEAEACFCRAIRLKPDFAEAHINLGNVWKELDRLEAAEASYRRALDIEPDLAVAQSNVIFCLNYIPTYDSLFLLEEAQKFGRMAAKKVREKFTAWRCSSRPERVRVGLVSGDLRNHPVGFFLESVLAERDAATVEFIAYSNSRCDDELTTRIRPFFTEWKSLAGVSDEAAADAVHRDGIHILIDLSGHTGNNRLPMFAWKPAPVQATWLGYLATTGVTEIDYLIGDHHVTPPETDHYYSEKIWRMPDAWGCLSPPACAVDVGPLPALSSGAVTFGCFNNLAKMNDAVVALWSRVLHAVPSSRLLLKTGQLAAVSVCETTRDRFAAHGIPAERLILEGGSPRAELLNAYNRVDIALDPFPYTGGTTNFEVLWMAVPFITLSGDRFISRGGLSVLRNAGLPDWVAENEDDYVALAVRHSSDLARLAALRAGLRRQVTASPLFDAARFARNLENALWGMWQEQGTRSAEAVSATPGESL